MPLCLTIPYLLEHKVEFRQTGVFENEAKINQALDRLMKGKTVFVIAHRLNTIQNADQIIVLNQGRIEETGTHEELLRKKGHYYEMVQEQQKAREWIVKGA